LLTRIMAATVKPLKTSRDKSLTGDFDRIEGSDIP
jgi:hypothetical protein